MQNLSTRMSLTQRACAVAAMTLLGALTAPAHATLIGDLVTATLTSPNGLLSDPTPINLSDTVTALSPAIEIAAGNGTNIGGFMLTGVGVQESIDFQSFSIVLRLLAGDPAFPIATGYAPGAKYVFSGLNLSGGETITGVSLTAVSIANLNQSWATLDNPNQISFALDQIQFLVPTSGTTFGDVTISFAHSVVNNPPSVPEPGSLLLAGVALLGLWQTGRGRKRST